MTRETVSSRIAELFGLTEEEYLRDRIDKGLSGRAMAREIGLSHVAVNNRLLRIAQPQRWVPKRRRRAA